VKGWKKKKKVKESWNAGLKKWAWEKSKEGLYGNMEKKWNNIQWRYEVIVRKNNRLNEIWRLEK